MSDEFQAAQLERDRERAQEQAAREGVVTAADISETHEPSPGEFHNRLQIVEAVVHHLVNTYHRNLDIPALVKAHQEAMVAKLDQETRPAK
jgi:hypothetical protein